MKANPLALLIILLSGLLGEWGEVRAQILFPPDSVALPPPDLPVLLIPGWFRGSEDLMPLKERFLRDGWPEGWVMALDFQDPVGSNEVHAREIKVAMEALLDRAGTRQVDMVAHSMGGLALWTLLQEEGDLIPIRRVVFLGSPLQGTLIAHLAWGEGGEEMRPESDFLERLEAGRDPSHWVEALTIRTPLDLTVVPNSGATLPGMGDRVVCCPTHQGLQDHEETFRVLRDFLLFGRRGRPPPDPSDGPSLRWPELLTGRRWRSPPAGPGPGFPG